MRPSRIRVTVIEDDACLLACLKAEISREPGLRCVGGHADFESAKEHIPQREADVILLDLGLPGIDGIDAIRIIKDQWPRLKVLVFTGHEASERIYGAFMAGANGFLLKSAARGELVDGIEKVYHGGAPMSPSVSNALISFFQARRLLTPHLSPTEKVILAEYDSGRPQKEIAQQLNISEHTLRTHANRILEKFGVSSLVRAAALIRRSNNI